MIRDYAPTDQNMHLEIVGYDLVEVSPAYDHSEITALAAATLALEMLYMEASKR